MPGSRLRRSSHEIHFFNKSMASRATFKSIELLKDQTLGIGSYGAVCKAKCDELICAAKIIHPTLVDPVAQYQITPQKEHRLPIKRFELECEFLSTIKHPNIVQYLGIHQDADTGLPVLLMELMTDSLTHFLESLPPSLPYHIQVNLCHDIAQALAYLHANNIVHRDLSGNNVLLIGDARAKVTDFGMASLVNSELTRRTFTMMPGTDVYMPPEAVADKPVYTEKIDCFSFGVITIQVLTHQFPSPGDRQVVIEDPRYPSELKMTVPETERRKVDISKVDPSHPLLQVSLDCLKDKPIERPSAQQVCERLSSLKEASKYSESISNDQKSRVLRHSEESRVLPLSIESPANEVDELKTQLQQITSEKDDIISRRDAEIAEKEELLTAGRQQIQELTDQATAKDQIIEEKERELEQVKRQVQVNEEVIAQFERRIEELEESSDEEDNSPPVRNSNKLDWRKGKDAPETMYRQCSAVANGSTVYFSNASENEIITYDGICKTWDKLPECPHEDFALVVLDDLPTIVGGKYDDEDYKEQYSNKLHSLVLKSKGLTWSEEYPPMPTKRSQATALCTGTALIVAGGRTAKPKPKPLLKSIKKKKDTASYFDSSDDEDEEMIEMKLTTVEVMNTETRQWSSVADLPDPLAWPSMSVCGDRIYILGDVPDDTNEETPSRFVLTCSRTALLQSRSRLLRTLSSSRVWSKVAGLPVVMSTCVTFHGSLLAVGGATSSEDDEFTGTKHVYRYDPGSNSWEVISEMSDTRYACFVAVISGNRLMVVGGETKENDKSVEFATLET